MEEKQLNLYQKLARIRKQVEVIQKDRSGFNYKYVTDDLILAKITGLMDKYELSLIPCIVPGTMVYEPYHYLKSKYNKATNSYYEEHNNEILVKSDMVYKWVNNVNPSEYIEIPWGMIGVQSDASQSFGSGLTYSFRYFLLKFFNVATPDDDPDKWRAKQREAEAEENKMIIDSAIKEIDGIAKSFLANNTSDEDKASLKEFIGKYVAKADYFKINDPVIAVQLLNDIKDWVKTSRGKKGGAN